MKKVVGIILVFCILLGSSTIYASGLPRTSLSKWYSQSFQKESEGQVGLAKVEKTFEDVNTFILETIKSYQTTIQEVIENQIKDSKAGIEEYQQETKSQLDEVVTELKEEKIDERIDHEAIDKEIDQDIDEVLIEVFGK
ncbi:hypothetical protein SAMN05421670_2683 [Psychrobacillus psychrotolerans]|uniref:Uncharacterized protein n=1 Tax=Psychrobacillus psychrotolerans TaxID=126156 RepID=A0A1I5ZGX4_9BACI|nr:hypothetical protein [Psychrobacillus psychrotolerans]SFQ55716.1 hypothetical protein SAMN05421670_2683 [Psychrobacillus psychrotolerans]